MNKAFKIISITAALAVVVGGAIVLSKVNVSAVDRVVGSGSIATIQDAVNAASDGDKVVIPAGTYNESFTVYNKKNIEIVGQGAVVINSQPNLPQPPAYKGIAIVDSSGVTLRNITVDGSATPTTSPGWVTGIDAVGAPNLTLDNVTVRNFGKNGIAINAAITDSNITSGAPASLTTSNVTLSNVSVSNAGWAGIAFYGVDTNNPGTYTDITGVSFVGTTTIKDTAYGIQFGASSTDTSVVAGTSGNAVDLGVVVFENNTANISDDTKSTVIVIDPASTIDGEAITAADFAGLGVTIESAAAAPKVPNTGVVY